jgi:hypothetical protein
MLRGAPLFTETQFFNKGPILFKVSSLHILQHPPTLANQNQQTPLARLIFLELFTVLRKLIYPLGQQRNLDLRRAGIFLVGTEPGYDGGYRFFV